MASEVGICDGFVGTAICTLVRPALADAMIDVALPTVLIRRILPSGS
jgi:hypothetical protein